MAHRHSIDRKHLSRQLSVRMSEDERQALWHIAIRRDTTLTVLLREAVTQYLQRDEKNERKAKD